MSQIQNEISNSISELDNTRFTKEELEKGFYEVQKQKNEKQKELEKIKEKNNEINEKIK